MAEEDTERAKSKETLEGAAEGANKASNKKSARNKQAVINTSGQAEISCKTSVNLKIA
jgi:hypothetical protein